LQDGWKSLLLVVITGLVPVIHVFLRRRPGTWMAGTSPAMTSVEQQIKYFKYLGYLHEGLELDSRGMRPAMII
jgi:hypothetical protein